MQERCRLTDIVNAMPSKQGSALHFRRGGTRHSVGYADCHRDALRVAARLRQQGIGPGSRVAIHGATSYDWVIADLASLLTGAVSVALYPSAPTSRAVATARESHCDLVFTDQRESAFAFAASGFPTVFLGPDGPPDLPSTDDFRTEPSGTWGTTAERGDGAFTIVSTSGTLSEPKLFAVHSAPLLHTMDRFAELYGFSGEDRLLLYLPLSHLPQRMMLYWGLGAGLDFVLSDPSRIAADSVAFDPTLHVAVPRSLHHLHARAKQSARRSGATGPDQLAHACASLFGTALKAVFVGSAPADPEVLADLVSAGLPVFEVYGTTELGMIGLNHPGACRAGTVGRPIPWGAVRIDADSGEIQVRTPTPFCYGHVDGTRIDPVVRDTDAWCPTGDVGALDDDGYLSVHGRMRDFLALSNGEKVFVRPLEDAVSAGTGAALTTVLKVDGNRLGALLFFDPGEPNGVADEKACRAWLADLNTTLHPWERLHSFCLFEDVPSVEEGCMTETSKPRRHMIEKVYGRDATWLKVREQ